MDLKEQDFLGPAIASHWYYVSKGRAMRSLLAGSSVDEVLDVGAGSGIFSRQLMLAGLCNRSVCVDPEYQDEHKESLEDGELTFVRSIDNPTQKLVLMMDVLEHVDDDVTFLRQYTKHLREDGRVLISVPAFNFLWSGHDVFLEHRRRYNRKMLLQVVHNANLHVESCRYFFGLLFPIAALARWVNQYRLTNQRIEPKSALKIYPEIVNTALTLLHDLERNTLFRFNVFGGLTLFCVARPRRPVLGDR
jgi:2-polyprenyl-3-methyl-5-hydroxy-6-metoxy-1,4-benzoquinol methylase